jgi:hypothetical protein
MASCVCSKGCGRVLKSTRYLADHEAKCDGLPPLQCVCGETFKDKFQKHRHKNKFHCTAKADCEVEEIDDACAVAVVGRYTSVALSEELEGDDIEEIVVGASAAAWVEDDVINAANAFQLDIAKNGYLLNGHVIRRTSDNPTRVSVYDLISAITGQDTGHINTYFTRLCNAHPEVNAMCVLFKFQGQGQRPTPVTDARGMVTIINLLPGPRAAQFRASSAEILVRYLGGDKTLVDEINRYAELQASTSSDNIVSIFGEAVAKRSALVTSISNVVVPPKAPGVYLANCSNPDTSRFVFNKAVPDGKDVVAYGYSASSMYSRVESQMTETGDYKFLDCFETPQALDLEQTLKAYVKFSGLETIKGTYTEPSGKKSTKTEFFLADADEYNALFEYMRPRVDTADVSKNNASVMVHELAMEEAKTRQIEAAEKTRQADASVAIEKEKTRQMELELEILRLKMGLELAKSGAVHP